MTTMVVGQAEAVERGSVSAEHFSFWYGEKQALKDINLSFPPRTVTAVS